MENQEHLQVDKFIPFGTDLKEILHHRNITPTKQRNILKSRGIFLNSNDISTTASIYSSILLSPSEFEKIKELVRVKEDSIKTSTRTLPFESEKTLIECLPDLIESNGLFENSNFKVTNITNFFPVEGNQDKVVCKISCETTNYNSSWYRNKNIYTAEIEITRNPEEKNATFILKYTSPESFDTVDTLSKQIVKEFKEKNFTKEYEDFQKITFGTFNNNDRVGFLLKLIDDSQNFTFQKVVNLSIAPDSDQELPALMQKLMSGGVQNLRIQGSNLSDNFLISDVSNHSFVELAGLDVIYEFDYSGAKGKCNIFYGFQNYLKKRNSNIEFHVDIYDIKLDKKFSNVNKQNVKNFLSQEFEKLKIKKFKEINENR